MFAREISELAITWASPHDTERERPTRVQKVATTPSTLHKRYPLEPAIPQTLEARPPERSISLSATMEFVSPSALQLTYHTILAFSIAFWFIGCLCLLVVPYVVSTLLPNPSAITPAAPPPWRQQQQYHEPAAWAHALGVGLKSRYQDTYDMYGEDMPPKETVFLNQESKEEKSSDNSEEGGQSPLRPAAAGRRRVAHEAAERGRRMSGFKKEKTKTKLRNPGGKY
ncbi:MAG: hypothetical protein Q9173_000663 [Seirophora scorigena]